MKKKPILERIGDFMAGKGFYIVLFLCVAAIGISGYYLFSSMNGDDGRTVSGPAQVTVSPTSTVTVPAVRPTVAPTVQPTPTPEPTPEPTPAPTPTPTAAPTAFTWPVRGDMLAAFSVEELVYNATMGDWRTHDGLDIAAAQGSQVCAAADGTVSAVTEDPLMGVCVTITHGGGMTTTYANLAAETMVEAGDHVNTGQVLGTVGDTAIAESALASHLHFSMALDGDAVDPAGYLS